MITISWYKEIPPIVRNIRDTVIYLVAGLLPFAAQIAGYLHTTVEMYSAGSGIAIIASKSLAKLFGVQDDNNMNVKVSAPKDAELNPPNSKP